jgi:outer membrane protein, multidrug efflux system
VPVGLPAALLERRPDLKQAEQQVRAAVARIGVARAERYPTISLSAVLGLDSLSLERLVDYDAAFGSLGAGLLAPILTGGRLDAQECAAQARFRQAEAAWILAVQSALKDVADALAAVKHTRSVSARLAEQVAARQRALDLATQRFEGELASYFEVLDAQRELFPAELQLAGAKRDEHVAVVRLYRALGGGWQPRPAPAVMPSAAAGP